MMNVNGCKLFAIVPNVILSIAICNCCSRYILLTAVLLNGTSSFSFSPKVVDALSAVKIYYAPI